MSYFAAVAAVEAMSHIYWHKPFPSSTNGTDLAERDIYSWCTQLEGPGTAASAPSTLGYIVSME